MRIAHYIAREADIPTLIQLGIQTWRPTYEGILSDAQIDYMESVLYHPETLRRQMLEEDYHFLLVREGCEPLAYAAYSPNEEGVYKLHKFYIRKEAQGKGIGRYLLDVVIADLRERKVSVLELNVNRYNLKAKAFYERRGFHVVETVDIPFGEYWLNDYVMRLRLDPAVL